MELPLYLTNYTHQHHLCLKAPSILVFLAMFHYGSL